MQHSFITRIVFMLIMLLGGLASTAATGYAQTMNASKNAPALGAPESTQKWRSQSDELPGMTSGKQILLIGAVTAGAVATYVFFNRKKNKKERASKMQTATTGSTTTAARDFQLRDDESAGFLNRVQQDARQMPVNVFIGLGGNGVITSDQGIMVGALVRF